MNSKETKERAPLTPESKLERSKLAIETRLKRADQALARKQFDLAKSQFEWEKKRDSRRGWRFLTTPTGVVVFVAALGLAGTALGKWADYLNEKRQMETTVILKASDVPQSLSPENQDVQRARNILWFAEAGYIDLPKRFLAKTQADAKLKPGEVPSPPVLQTQSITTATRLTESLEGFSSKEYTDVAGNPAIGFGHLIAPPEMSTGRIQIGNESIPFADGISQKQAEVLLQQDLAPAYKVVDELIKVPLTQDQRDVLADFIFSVGPGAFRRSTIVSTINAGRFEDVPEQLERWSYLGGRINPGILRRRTAEGEVWKKPPAPTSRTGTSPP